MSAFSQRKLTGRRRSGAGGFDGCDAPAILNNGTVVRLDEIEGWMPLSPRMLTDISQTGSGSKWECRDDISSAQLEDINRRLILNAERSVYFSSANQRTKYLNRMAALRA
ncbi:hypothetical protein LMG28614_00754 [Paraburkholderia ultramafica]|uniref:Uncharacterized protein n=1 Tax=Paraburkholderia ultramafica TaxID=1544867 RepID=A0A6S7B6G1_9BURK|nr:hypothetical protein [Paraburkholderia ultramafica]CAB3779196.1 hypothetical protein LMG28614_00754 [Paraburkholderia ultramafica]